MLQDIDEVGAGRVDSIWAVSLLVNSIKLALKLFDMIGQGAEPVAEFGEPVLDARRDFRVDAFLENAKAHELAEPLIQHFPGNPLDRALHRAGAVYAAPHQAQHRDCPFAANDILEHASRRNSL